MLEPVVERPTEVFYREEVRAMMIGLVPEIHTRSLRWLAFLAVKSQLCEVVEDMLMPPEDWIAAGNFIDQYEVEDCEEFVDEDMPVLESGNLTTAQIGEAAIILGGYQFYRKKEASHVDAAVVEMYFDKLLKESEDIPPMQANYDTPYEMGRALRKGRIDQALEIVGALKHTGKTLYFPGDGIGCFSYAAMRLGVNYISSEPGGVGQIARDLGLIRSKDSYNVAIDAMCDCIMVASNLMPFCPQIMQWPGEFVVFDAQCFWHDHPPRLRPVWRTGYKLYATEGAQLKLVPRAVAYQQQLSVQQIQMMTRELEARRCEAYLTDDKHTLVALLEAHQPVYSNIYADTGHPCMLIEPPRANVQYLIVGATAGAYDIRTRVDHNTTKTGELTATYVYGRAGTMIYGTVGDIDQHHGEPFAKRMSFKTVSAFQKIYGKTRCFRHHRLIPYEYEGRSQMAFCSKTKPPPNVVCLMGRRVISAIVIHTEVVGSLFYNVVRPGADVATVDSRDVWRHESYLEHMLKSGKASLVNNAARRVDCEQYWGKIL